MLKLIFHITLIFIVQAVFAQNTFAQNSLETGLFQPPQDATSENRMRISAGRYLARGDYQNALNIYRSLRSRPEGSRYDFNYFQGELKCLLGLEEYVEAELLVRKEVRMAESERKNLHRKPEYLAHLGQVYLAQDREEEAWEMFNRAIANNPVNPNIYRIVAGMMMQARQDEKAVEILIRGEDRMKNGNLANDIAQLYSRMMDYKNSVDYYMKYLLTQPKRYSAVERAIYAFPATEEVRKVVISELKYYLENPQIVKLLSGYLFSLGRYDEALIYTVKMDSDGSELLRFAESVQSEDRCDLALQAYSSAMHKKPAPQLKMQIMSGMAECFYLVGYPDEAVTQYRQIIEQFKFTLHAESAMFKLGMIHQQDFNDPDSAEYYFNQVRTLFPRGKYAGEAMLALANNAIVEDDLDTAVILLQKLIDRDGRKDLELRSRAMLIMGRCLLWSGDADSAFAVWNRLVRTLPGLEAANDALYDAICLKEADSVAVASFAGAWLKMEQRSYVEAHARFKSLSEKNAGTVIGGRSAIEAANAQQRISGGEDALLFLADYLEEFPQTGLLDEIYYRMGEICLTALDDPVRARTYFEELLVQTPDSPRAPVVRRRLEVMTGGV